MSPKVAIKAFDSRT